MSTVSAPGGPDVTAWPPREGVTAAHGRAVLNWAAGTSPGHPRVCLVRGARGSGKSQLLAWFLMGSAGHPRTTVHATVLSAGLFTDAFAWELGRQLGYGPLSPARLLDRLTVDQRPLLLLVPDLHRSGRGPADRPPAHPATLVQDLLLPLLELPQTRAIVEVGDSGLLDGWAPAQPAEPARPAEPTLTIDVGDKPFGNFAEPAEGDGEGDLTAQLRRTSDGRPLWDLAPETVREHALDQALLAPDSVHAVRALLTDPGFLLHGSPVSIAACLADERIPTPPGLRQTWRLAAPQLSDPEHSAAQRAALLHAAALGAGPALARYLLPLAEGHVFTAVWSRPDAALTALAPVPGGPGDGQGELLAADPLGDLTLLDAATGLSTAVVPVPSPSTARPQGIAVRHDRSLLLLTDTGALYPAGEDPTAVLGHIAAHHGQAALRNPDLRPCALGQCPHGGITVIGDEQGNAHVWSMETPQAVPHSRALHSAPVTAVACLAQPDDQHTLVMSAAMDGTVRLWETSADPMPAPVEQRPALVTAMAAAQTAHGPVLAVAWSDATLHLWQILTGRVRPIPLLVPCRALALSRDSRLTVGGPEGAYAVRLDTARLWD
ncbi:hypothetical protein [Actinacidiphila oryziradicis]|uniref:WD40 repeat domain-containing protein n=1 Tax=Actinacidiphila oryziradicis TaxID=2571141 RepID=UPI0023F16BD8|nr:hypothetical protein [Actinacidiphila oryziradicis]MCW2874288.1 hypothetical protein [Actinacidiphila oryziradicis]